MCVLMGLFRSRNRCYAADEEELEESEETDESADGAGAAEPVSPAIYSCIRFIVVGVSATGGIARAVPAECWEVIAVSSVSIDW